MTPDTLLLLQTTLNTSLKDPISNDINNCTTDNQVSYKRNSIWLCQLHSEAEVRDNIKNLAGSNTFQFWTLNMLETMGYIGYYSIHVPGWLLKWLNLMTAHGSVSNEPGSVTWLATKYLKAVSWRNHTEKITLLWSHNISFLPKFIIPTSYLIISMLNCLENTLNFQFDSYMTAVNFLT